MCVSCRSPEEAVGQPHIGGLSPKRVGLTRTCARLDVVSHEHPPDPIPSPGVAVIRTCPACFSADDVSYQRLFYRGGSVVKRENFFWRYAPTDRVRCVSGGD